MQAAASALPEARLIEPSGHGPTLVIGPQSFDLGHAVSPNGDMVLVDGEVYELPDRSRPPNAGEAARLILDLYLKQGASCLSTLHMGAVLAIWDAGQERLILASDRAGLSPCYFMQRGDALFWSSEIIRLVEIDRRTELDPAAIDAMLAGGFVPTPWTTLKHIRKLPPSYLLEATARETRMERYWWPRREAKISLPDHERRVLLDRLIEDAVRRRLPDRKAAILLSGGVDSTLLMAYLKRRCGAELEAYTFRYDDYDGVFNEGERARRAAQFCGVRHHEMEFRPADLADRLGRILIEHHGPLSFGVHTSILDRMVADGAQLLFGGHGADSFFYSRTEELGLALGRWPSPAVQMVRWTAEGLKRLRPVWSTRLGYAARIAQTGLPWRFHSPLTSERLRAGLYVRPSQLQDSEAAAEALYRPLLASFNGYPESDRLPLVTQRFFTALHWTQAFARGSGMAARCPYVDNDIVDFFYGLARSGGKKDELRDVATEHLPPELARSPKVGQTLPIAAWLRGPLTGFMREMLEKERLDAVGLLRPDMVNHLADSHLTGQVNHGWTLWILICITEWNAIVRARAGKVLEMLAHAA